jgi:hypothetical protein
MGNKQKENRDRRILHAKLAHMQRSKASIEAAQSENKKLVNKKASDRKECKASSTTCKHRNSSSRDGTLQKKFLWKSWQNFLCSHSNEKQSSTEILNTVVKDQTFTPTAKNTCSTMIASHAKQTGCIYMTFLLLRESSI